MNIITVTMDSHQPTPSDDIRSQPPPPNTSPTSLRFPFTSSTATAKDSEGNVLPTCQPQVLHVAQYVAGMIDARPPSLRSIMPLVKDPAPGRTACQVQDRPRHLLLPTKFLRRNPAMVVRGLLLGLTAAEHPSCQLRREDCIVHGGLSVPFLDLGCKQAVSQRRMDL